MLPVIVLLWGANSALDSVRRAVFKRASMETIAGFVAPFLGWLTFVSAGPLSTGCCRAPSKLASRAGEFQTQEIQQRTHLRDNRQAS